MDLIEDVRKIIKNYFKADIIFGKNEEYVLDRIGAKKEEVIEELISGKYLEFVEKQERAGETRYALFFVYFRKKGRVYIIKCGDKLRIVTAYPLGKKTLHKYKKKRFIR